MHPMNQQDLLEFNENDSINIKEVILKYLRFWPWYLGSMLLFMGIAKIQLRYSNDIYSTSTTIKILDDSKDGEVDLSGLPIGGKVFQTQTNLDNEILILSSKRLLRRVIEELELETSYHSKGNVTMLELYGPNQPFKLEWAPMDSTDDLAASPAIHIVFETEHTFSAFTEGGFRKDNIKFGDAISVGSHVLKMSPIEGSDYEKKASKKTEFIVQYVPAIKRAYSLAKQLRIAQVGESEILKLSLDGPNKRKNEDILDKIVHIFNEDGENDKRQVAERTEEFVSKRLDILSSELDSIENDLIDVKQTSGVVNIETDAGIFSLRDEEYRKIDENLQTQLLLAEALSMHIGETDSFDLVPVDFGIADPVVTSQIDKCNELILELNKLSVGRTHVNPEIIQTKATITQFKNVIKGSLNSYQESLKEQIAQNEAKMSFSNRELGRLPEYEHILRDISRQQSIKENLYLFLLEKRESASLSKAITKPSVKVVDYSYTDPSPVAPNRRGKFITSFFIGLILPIIVVYLRFLMDTKVHNRDDVNRVVMPFNIPILGEVPQLPKESEVIITPNDRSELAEAFRVLRTNVSYLLSSRDLSHNKCPIFIVTSSTKSEGKTFTSLNVALTLASSDKRVLLIGADLRNPQLHQYFGSSKNVQGLTSYLHSDELDFHELIKEKMLGFKTLDVILSGFIPPNPAELLLNGRFETLLSQAKEEYDYIIIDSAPTLLVTDTLLISNLVDACIYLVRAGVTESKILDHIVEVSNQKKLPHMGIVLNGVGSTGSYGYGYRYKYNYGYGYSYDADKPKAWWKFWK